MPRRVALIVGVSEYVSLSHLPAAARDAQVMAHVLKEIAGFDDVSLVLNPDQERLAEAIELLFAGRDPEDLGVLYFSGHGVKDERGHLFLAVPNTRKHPNGELVRATAVSCGHVHDVMTSSRSRRQVVILDCCFSAAFAEGMAAKDGGEVDLRNQLGGEGRAVLASSSSTQYSFEPTGAGLSTYTQYLVHGITSGEADLNHDGLITVDELHEFAKARVKAQRPAMSPQILPIREGYSIVIASARKVDPRRAYAAKVREVAGASGAFSRVGLQVLALRRQQLGIAPIEAEAIEEAELAPRRARATNRMELRKAVHDARRRGRINGELGLLNELRIALDLSERDLQELVREPYGIQRRAVLGWRFWPQRLAQWGGLGIAFVAVGAFGIKVRSWVEPDPVAGTADTDEDPPELPPPELPPPEHPPRPEPGRFDVGDNDSAELPDEDPTPPDPAPSTTGTSSDPFGGLSPTPTPTPTPPTEEVPISADITAESWVIRIKATRSLYEAQEAAWQAAASADVGGPFRAQIVYVDGLPLSRGPYRVFVGPYASHWHAQASAEAAKRILERGVMVENMSAECRALGPELEGLRHCYQ